MIYDWLGVWESETAPGKHTKKLPAQFAHGYKFGGFQSFRDPHSVPHMGGVDRAIPADGTVTDVPPTWIRSPQARMWLENRKTLTETIRDWLVRTV